MTTCKAFGCGLAAAAALLLANTAEANVKNAATLQVTVKTSFGTKFTDCWSFGGETQNSAGGYSGTLTTASGLTLTYATENFGTSLTRFTAVSPLAVASQLGFGIEFNGTVLGNGSNGYASISGNDEAGDSYIISGPVVTSCGANVKGKALGLYHR